MAILKNTFAGGTNDTQITVGNSGGASGDPFAHIFANGSAVNVAGSPLLTYSNALAGLGLPMTVVLDAGSATGDTYLRWDSAETAGRYVARRGFYFTGTTTSTRPLLIVRNASGVIGSINWRSTPANSLGLAVGTGSVVAESASAALSPNTLYWLELAVTPGTGGNLSIRILSASESEVHSYSHNADLADGPVVQYRFGGPRAEASGLEYLGQLQAGPLSSGWLGPIGATEQLATPVLTLTGTTPASPASSDGTATVTWPAVPNASGYRALTAPFGTSDYETSTETVTSPHTFTGLSGGGIRLAIQAKGDS